MKYNKKLIEVALPLEAINIASAREKSIRHGHPSSLHLWWSRKPLATARAVIFAQMVDDPSEHPDLFPTKKKQEIERLRLMDLIGRIVTKKDAKTNCVEEIIEGLVSWENTTNKIMLKEAENEIWKSWRRTCAENADHLQAKELFDSKVLPAFHDPFAGGGTLPLEAQRLGLKSYASDLNPVSVLINKAMIEIPPKFAGIPPMNPESRKNKTLFNNEWSGSQGLAEDVRYYGKWVRDEAEKRIGYLYPKIKVTEEMIKEQSELEKYVGKELNIIAWLWVRTVKSPNPAFSDVNVPLAPKFWLSSKSGKEIYVEPVIDLGNDDVKPSYHFIVKVGIPTNVDAIKNGTSAGKRGGFRCLMSDTPITYDYIRDEGKAGRMGTRLMSIVAEGGSGRVYLNPTPEMEAMAYAKNPEWKPETPLHGKCRVNVSNYGFDTYGDLFTPRQLIALTTLSDLVQEVREKVQFDILKSGLLDNGKPLCDEGTGAIAYADAVSVYLAFALSKQADLSNSLCRWEPVAQCPRQLFGRQAIPMIWDFAEGNPLGDSSGSWVVFVDGIVKAFAKTFEHVSSKSIGSAQQADAGRQEVSNGKVISTDPPYYDNIGYADLSDFFYV